MVFQSTGSRFWLDEVVDSFLDFLKKERGLDTPITLSAGMTPSCPIHFGIFREILLSYFVTEELKKRGFQAHLIYFWDDFDHFCKIPYYSQKEEVASYLGMPLCEVPDFEGAYPSYGEHHMRVFENNLKYLGIEPEFNYQSELYNCGAYDEYIKKAVDKRYEVFDFFNEQSKPYTAAHLADRDAYYPVSIYCASCRRDSVTIDSYDHKNGSFAYTCKKCHHTGVSTLGKDFSGKLVWKVNWAMRWKDYGVDFESSGENQLTDTGSYAVASKIVSAVFGGSAPFSLLYRFVGIPGVAKVSRSLGKRALSSHMTDLLEPAIIRWLFLKNSPERPFSVDLEANLHRIYHEWDELLKKNIEGTATAQEARVFSYATEGVGFCQIPVLFKNIVIALGVTNGDAQKAAQLLLPMSKSTASLGSFFEQIQPRLICAAKYLFEYNNRDEAPVLLSRKNTAVFTDCSQHCRKALAVLSERLSDVIEEPAIAQCIKEVPESIALDNESTDILRKEFYRVLYLLLIGREKGPRLSTLLYFAGKEKSLQLIKEGE